MKTLVGVKEVKGVSKAGNNYANVILYYTEPCKSSKTSSQEKNGVGLEAGEITVFVDGFINLSNSVDVVGGEFQIGSEFEAYYVDDDGIKKLNMISVKSVAKK